MKRRGNRIRLTESQLNRVIKESVKNVLSEEDEQERYHRIWKEHRYMSISLNRALYLLDRLGSQIQHTPEVRKIMGELEMTLYNAATATETSIGSGLYRYTEVPNYDEFK